MQTMTTTAHTISHDQIRKLRREARSAGDALQAAICDLALGEVGDDAGPYLADSYSDLRGRDARLLNEMTRDEAIAECARVLADAEAQDRNR